MDTINIHPKPTPKRKEVRKRLKVRKLREFKELVPDPFNLEA